MSGALRRGALRFRSGETTVELALTQDQVSFVPEGYKLVWKDEFSGPSSSLATQWRYEDWRPGFVNHELQRYVPDDRRTSYIEDGALHIVALKADGQVISARMNSRASWLFDST